MSYVKTARGHLKGGGPHCLYLGQGSAKAPHAQWMVSNAAAVRACPFDGIFFQIDASSPIMNTTPVSEASIVADIAGFGSADFGHCTHNWPTLYMEGGYMPADYDWFSNSIWNPIVQNWANLASACAGNPNIDGILLDNEPYDSGWNGTTHPFPFDWRSDLNPSGFETPDGPGIFDVGVTFAQARDQVHLRGKQIMDAVIAEWPEARVMFLHGAYTSFPETITELGYGNDISFAHEVNTAWTAGFVEACYNNGYRSMIVDGGEKYEIHEQQQAWVLNRWRHKMARTNPGSVIKPSFAPFYRTDNAIGSMDLDVMEQYPNSPPHTNAELEDMVMQCLKSVDTYYWLYCEDDDWLGITDPPPDLARETALRNGIRRGKRGGS